MGTRKNLLGSPCHERLPYLGSRPLIRRSKEGYQESLFKLPKPAAAEHPAAGTAALCRSPGVVASPPKRSFALHWVVAIPITSRATVTLH